ncbi:DUF402 domain-containing protein [Bacillus sp. Bva_UNVM-123]|uniref:DUF402 domain-containing protein n=1 Tax=Bacillus sp. Bva_UNVM-123 TaxID=2829798 RepID=UPI00391F3DD5
MLKRKHADRSSWGRVLKSKYAQTFLETNEFIGYITLIKVDKVTEPLIVHYGENRISIVDNGYMWLQQFPKNTNHSMTTMFNPNGEIIQWYVDICLRNGITNNIPWLDDLYLDIILLPSGEIFLKDVEELDEALLNGIVNESQYTLAWDEANKIVSLVKSKDFNLINLADFHKEILVEKLKNNESIIEDPTRS